MSLWGCNCPLLALPALAACHRRGMVCSQLSLFSPLFCVWAWRRFRLELAFSVVVITQSCLLAQVSWLSLPSGHSGQILTVSTAARALLVAGAGICAALLLHWGSYCWARNLWVLIIYLFFLPVMLPSVLPRLTTDLAVGVFPGVWKLLSFQDSLPGTELHPYLFCLFFCLL